MFVQTKKIYNVYLQKKIITEEMLELALYSINKRAKNWRDKKNEYYRKNKEAKRWNRFYEFDKYGNIEKCKQKEQEYYAQKDFLLKTLLKPVCVHCVEQEKTSYRRIYDYEDEYYKYHNKGYYENSYWDEDEYEEVHFVDVPENTTENQYFLFYETSNYSFHIPLTEEQVKKEYSILPIIKINELETTGKDIIELASTQFCKKLIDLVKSNDFTYIKDNINLKITI